MMRNLTTRRRRAVLRAGTQLRNQSGFSLLELLVTLALVGLVVVLSLPGLSHGRGGAGLSSDARLLAARLRAAREMALVTRSTTHVNIDITNRGIGGIGVRAEDRFTSANRVTVTTARGKADRGTADIIFAPDGSSSGGEVTLESGSLERRVRVEWLTGAVVISGRIQ